MEDLLKRDRSYRIIVTHQDGTIRETKVGPFEAAVTRKMRRLVQVLKDTDFHGGAKAITVREHATLYRRDAYGDAGHFDRTVLQMELVGRRWRHV